MHQQAGLIFQFLTGGLVKETAPWSGVLFTVAMVFLCVGLEKVFDLPVRKWLRRKLLR
jgi:peptidoglycan/LPS O-acetylase OafA/YrhL